MREDLTIAEAELPPRRQARVDFHIHSYASNVTDYYASNSLAIPESYSDPLEIYRLLKARGMDLVTLTDHNSIDGVKVMLDAGPRGRLHQRRDDRDLPRGRLQHPRHGREHLGGASSPRSTGCGPNVYEMVAYLDERIRDEAAQRRRSAASPTS